MLKLACFYIHRQHRISLVPDAGSITVDKVRRFPHLRETKNDHSDPEELPKLDPKNWSKTLEAIQEYLRGFLGTTKVPLSYVIRDQVNVSAANANPAAG